MYGRRDSRPIVFRINFDGTLVWESVLDVEGSLFSLNTFELSNISEDQLVFEELVNQNSSTVTFVADIVSELAHREVDINIENGVQFFERQRNADEDIVEQDIPLPFTSYIGGMQLK